MAKLIGTAGHVDHGKTTLIRALTSIDADRLPEEKRRGMTIDIGFAYIDLPDHGRVSIVDVPGHEKFLTNMLVGAMAIDVALLCISADESVMPQTREHLQILELLPVTELVVAMTRSDLADAEMREFALTEIGELLTSTRFAGAVTIPVSALTGEGLEDLKSTLNNILKKSHAGESSGAWYLPIDRVFTVKGYGTVVTGTLAQGTVRMDEPAEIQPTGLTTRIRGIEWHDDSQPSSERGRRTALNLAGVKLEDVHRGMVVGAPGAAFSTTLLDAKVSWINLPKHAARVRVSIGADEVIGKVLLNDHDQTLVQIKLERATAAAVKQPLILRAYSPPTLLGGGRVLVPVAKLRKKSEVPGLVEVGTGTDPILALISRSPFGELTEEICRRLGSTPQALGDDFERLKADGSILGFAGLWITPENFDDRAQVLLQTLEALHQEQPGKAFLPRELVLRQAKLPWKGKPLDRILSHLVGRDQLRQDGTEIAAFHHVVKHSPKQEELLARVLEAFDNFGVNVPPPVEVAKVLHIPPQAVEEMIRLGLEARKLVRVADGIVYTPTQLTQIKDKMRELDERFTAAEFRDLLGTTRKYGIPLLEYFDATGFTARQGDVRILQ